MDNSRPTPKNIDEYIAGYPADIQQILQKIRALIHETAPEAQETISYQVPTFTLKGNLVHFAAFKSHISFFPASSGVEKFKNELEGYKTSKGTIQFPLGQPIPYDLIRRIVLFRVQENLARAEAKAKKKK
jgi:uncharacterized protein YdhG (YjbR/CyaY superfamily)